MIKKYILEVKYWVLTLLFAWKEIPYYVRRIDWLELVRTVLSILVLILFPLGIILSPILAIFSYRVKRMREAKKQQRS